MGALQALQIACFTCVLCTGLVRAFAATPTTAPITKTPPATEEAPVTKTVQPGTTEPQLQPPQASDANHIGYPHHAPPLHTPITVPVLVRVDAEGGVERVELIAPGDPLFDAATLTGATHFRFTPARYGNDTVPVEIRFEQHFTPPTEPAPNHGEDAAASAMPNSPDGTDALLVGTLIERGTRKPITDATIVAMLDGHEWITTSDARGVFRLPVHSGTLDIRVAAPAYLPFRQRETFKPSQQIRVQYRVDRVSYSTYETVVTGQKDRTEIARTTLRGREIKRIPGSFGDPFRVIMALPGTSQLMSLLPVPVVRGSSPGNTGFLLDGVRMPLLFHLLAGPSVIHPEFIDQIDFYPGGFPVEYGGYTAGIVDGKTRAAQPGEKHDEFNLDLANVGGFVRYPIMKRGHVNATVAGRYGYPSLLLRLANADARLDYWDYQARVEGRSGAHRWTVFALGGSDHLQRRMIVASASDDVANDEDVVPGTQAVPSSKKVFESVAKFQFHRLDLRYQRAINVSDDFLRRMGAAEDRYQWVFGFDQSKLGQASPATSAWNVTGRFSWQRPVHARVKLEWGLQTYLQHSNMAARQDLSSGPHSDEALTGAESTTHLPQLPASAQSDNLYSVGIWIASPWRPTDNLVLVPGVRADMYVSGQTIKASADPRLSVRYRVYQHAQPVSSDVADTTVPSDPSADPVPSPKARWFGDVWIKGGVGWYHQPPRLFVPMPGFAVSSLDHGLLGALQNSLGVETPLVWGLTADVQGYFNYMSPLFFEPAFNDPFDSSTQSGPIDPATANLGNVATGNIGGGNVVSDLLQRRVGRAYGMEVMLRKQDDGRVFGWLAYTLSRSERRRDGKWVPFDFNRTHILNFVAGYRLPRNWEISGRMQMQSGSPLSTINGFNAARTPVFVRFDLRIDKRAVWNNWLLDFYVDVINVGLSKETGGLLGGSGFRYVLPTIGIRAIM